MKCFECGTAIEENVYVCPNCGTEFGEEEILLMLHIDKKARQRQARIHLAGGILILVLVAAVLGLGGGLWAKNIGEKRQASRSSFNAVMEKCLSEAEGVKHYAFDEEGAALTVERTEFMALSDTQREDYILLLQQQIMQLRFAAGLSKAEYYIIEIFDEEGELLLYTDEKGNVVEK